MRRQHEFSQRIIDSSPQKKLHGGQLDITSLQTYQSLEFRSEKCMASHADTQAGTCIRIQSEGLREDENLLINFLMVCIENQRMTRLSEKSNIAKQTEKLAVGRLTEECSMLRQSINSKTLELRTLNEQSLNIKVRLNQLQILLKDKELQLVTKDKQASELRLTLHQIKSKKQYSQNSLIRSLEIELNNQKTSSSDANKKKEEFQFQLKLLQQKELQWKSSQAGMLKKIQQTQEELSLLKSEKDQQQHNTQLIMHQIARENEVYVLKINDLNKLLLQNEQNNQKLEQENCYLRQDVQQKQHILEQMQQKHRKIEESYKEKRAYESEELKKQLLIIESKMGQLATASQRQKQLDNRSREVERIAKERDNLHSKLTILMEEMTRLQKIIASKEQCQNCQSLTISNSLLNRRLGVLEQSLIERETEIDRLLSVQTVKTTVKTTKTEKVNLKELKCSMEQLKGSADRVSQLLDVSNVGQLPHYSQTAVQRSFIFQSM